MTPDSPRERMRAPTTQDTAQLLQLKQRIEGLSTPDKLRLCAGLLENGIYEPIIETLLDRAEDAITDTPRECGQRIDEPPEHIVALAIEVSGWSPCRSKRGVVIFRGENVVSHGYNYKPRGFDCEQTDECKRTCRKEAVHAEQQALLSAQSMPGRSEGADMLHVKTVSGALVASGGPSCVECSKLARACGIAGVWLYHEAGWRRYEISEFHQLSLEALVRGAVPPAPQRCSGYSPQEAPAPPPLEAQQAEEAVYHAYVEARSLREKYPASCREIDKVLDGLHAARRFIFDSYQTKRAAASQGPAPTRKES